MIFGISYGQKETELNNEQLVVKATHWITDKCSDLNNRYENDLCVKKEIFEFVNKKLNWTLTDSFPKGIYEIRMNLVVEQNGEISKVVAKSEYDVLNKELEKILMLYPNQVKLIDQNGKAYKNNLIFPMKFIVE